MLEVEEEDNFESTGLCLTLAIVHMLKIYLMLLCSHTHKNTLQIVHELCKNQNMVYGWGLAWYRVQRE
jgi:hypothetical protein